MFSVSRNTIWNWSKSLEGFPSPVKIGGASRWHRSDLEMYIAGLNNAQQQVAK
jgi:predicted DNA-binding transcriptional regulator AlpA